MESGRFPPQRLLVPFDFSMCSEAALQVAMQLGSRWRSRLELVHVAEHLPDITALQPELIDPASHETVESCRKTLEDRLRENIKDYPGAGVRVLEGSPRAALTLLLDGKQYDLAVMGTRGRTGISHMLLGSTAEAAVRTSAVPVLTVHWRRQALWPNRILVPLNFTDYSDLALQYAAAMADDFTAHVTVLHVAEEGAARESVSQRMERRLADVLGEEKAKNVDILIERGARAERILHFADAMAYDLIVLSSHRKPILKFWRTGQTAELVLRYSPIPVLSIPAGVDQRFIGVEPRLNPRRLSESPPSGLPDYASRRRPR